MQQRSSAKVVADGSPEWVARQVRERNQGRDSRAELRMRLFDRQGRVRERVLTMLTLQGQKGTGDRSLIRFTYPNDIRNTAFLVWEHPDADDERFLYLPALGRVRRIAGQEKDESFVGSDLSYEDIGPAAMLSRAIGGVRNKVIILTMPGSVAAVRLAMEKLIVPEIGHLVYEARK